MNTKKDNHLIPVAICFFSVAAFLLVMNYAITKPETAKKSTTVATQKYSDSSTGVSFTYPKTWHKLTCGDDALVYVAPTTITCGAGLKAVSVMRRPTTDTLDARKTALAAELTGETTASLTIDGHSATRMMGNMPGAMGGAATAEDVVLLTAGGRTWEVSNNLTGQTTAFMAMVRSMKF